MATRHLPLRLTLQINLDDLDQTAPGGQHQHFEASYRTHSVDFRHSIQCRWCTKCFTKWYLQLFQPVHLVKFCTPVEFMFSVTVLQLWGLKLKLHTVCAGHQVTTDAIHWNNCFFAYNHTKPVLWFFQVCCDNKRNARTPHIPWMTPEHLTSIGAFLFCSPIFWIWLLWALFTNTWHQHIGLPGRHNPIQSPIVFWTQGWYLIEC